MSNVFKFQSMVCVALLAAAVLAVAQAPQADFVGLDVVPSEAGVQIQVAATGEWSYRSFTMQDPPRFVVDMVGCDKRVKANRFAGDGDLVQVVRSSQFKTAPESVSRLVIELGSGATAAVTPREGGLDINVTRATSAAEQAQFLREHDLASDTASLLPEVVGGSQVVYEPLPLTSPVPLADNWQDESGLSAVAETARRQDEASYARAMNLNMQNADINTVLRAVANFSGRNIISAPDVTGTVTVALVDVPWKEALSVILRANSFGFVEENGIIRVDTAENLRTEELAAKAALKQSDDLEPLTTQIIGIDFANAVEVKDAVGSMLTNRGSVEVDERTNSLIVSDIPSRIETVTAMAKNLDTRTPQVHIDALLVDMDSRKSREIGITWGGYNLQPADLNIAGSATSTNSIAEAAGQIAIGTVQSFGEIRSVIQGLARNNLAKIISNPRITTTNNREANILVGQKIPLITTDVAGNPITRLETIGIRLIVTPHINSDDQITMDVHPEVSDLSSQATVQGGVIINTSEADTRVLVANKETAVIGGLIRSVTTSFESGVPVLKDIPLLGALFRSETESEDQRELIVFLTPTIVEGNGVATERQMKIMDDVNRDMDAASQF